MALIVVNGTKRSREFITDLDRKAPPLGKCQVMCVGGCTGADEAWPLRDQIQMFFVSRARFCANGEPSFVDPATGCDSRWLRAKQGGKTEFYATRPVEWTNVVAGEGGPEYRRSVRPS